MKLLGLDHPFFRPLWRRVLVVMVCVFWAILEMANGSTGWAGLFVVIAVICTWQFVIIDYDNLGGSSQKSQDKGDE